LSLVTVISIFGVLVGVALLNCVLAVMTGFEQDLRDKILGANAHIVILKYGGGLEDSETHTASLLEVDGVEAAAPFIYSEMMIRSPWKATGIIFKGVDPERTGLVTDVLEDLSVGMQGPLEDDEARAALFSAMAEPFTDRGVDGEPGDPLPGILIGRELGDTLQVIPGDKVQVINPLGNGGGLMGMPTPSVKNFRVAGVFYSGMFEYDTKWTYVANSSAQDFLKMGDSVTGIEVKVDDIDEVDGISREIDTVLGYPHYTRHWRNLNQALFEALELEKVVMGLILGMVVVVAGLLIVSNLYMIVLTKRREISILRAMGASAGAIQRVFVLIGSTIGLVGTSLGTVFGLAGCWLLERYEYPLETDVYYLSSLPVVVEPVNVVIIAVGAFVVCFLATLYPARRAAALNPVEGLRYE
jgi:lipoprotein-releasing system permease protein